MITARSRFWLRCAASLVFIGLVAWRLNWHGLSDVLLRVDITLLLAGSALTPGLLLLLAIRWRIFLRQQSIPTPMRIVFSLTWAGQFFNSVLPGSTGGDFVKIYQLCRMFPDKKAPAAASVIVDRITGLIALAVLAGIGLIAGPPLDFSRFGLSPSSAWLWVAGSLVMSAVLLALVLRVFARPHWVARLRYLLFVLKTSFNLNANMVLAVAMAFAIHLLTFGMLFLFARALGIAVTCTQIFLFWPVVLVLLLIPITVNGHGLRELLLVYYFTQLHIGLSGHPGVGAWEIVPALTILAVSNDFLWSLPGGLWYLLRKDSHSAGASSSTLSATGSGSAS